MTTFGSSAPYDSLVQHFGFTADKVVAAAKAQLGKVSLYKAIAEASKDVLPSPEAMDVGMALTIPLLHPKAARTLTGR